ncbi:MAG TPA: ABC transporter substrate-binding protein [Vicinamibacterales bacterium]|nr:ABC transporter substrate-binding protein [Vicinamibacterales bacterium]
MRRLLVSACLLASASAAACSSASNAGQSRPVTLVVALASDPGALNPAVTTSGNTHPVTDQLFNGLVGLDEAFNPVPELAERWSIEDDGRTYRFFLRPGVRWHDGTPFTSADVRFTFEAALLRYHSRTRAALEGVIEAIETPDDLTVIFRLTRPYSPLLQRLDVVEASIIPRHQYDGHDLLTGEPTRRPIGTGPFRIVSHTPSDRIVLERNTQYFRPGLPRVDRVVFRILPNAAAAVAALEAGEVDYVSGVPGPAIPRLRASPAVTVVPGTAGPGGALCQDVLIPNLARRPFNDPRVRRAFAHAIDRAFIHERVYYGLGRVATGPISHLMTWAYTADVPQYRHDPAEANRLLDAAGHPRGRDGVRMRLTFTHAATHQRLGQALREGLKLAGIDLALETRDFNAAVEQVFVKKAFDLGVASYCNGVDPDIGVRRAYVSSNIGPYPFSNGAGYRNPRIDALFEEASRQQDRARRRDLYVEIQRILAADVPYFWLVDTEALRAHRSTFTGFRPWTGAFLETVAAVAAETP